MSENKPECADDSYLSPALLIDGTWRTDRPQGEQVLDPSTEQVLGRLPHATPADLHEAATAAARVFPLWSNMPALVRKRALNRTAALLRERTDRIAQVMVMEQGKPLAEARAEVASAADIFEWYGDEAIRLYDRYVPSRIRNTEHRVSREPVGPVAAFTPWNFPALTPARKIAGALAAGCTIVLKAAEQTPGTAIELMRACQDADIPKGAVNLVFGVPGDVSTTLVEHPAIAKVSFTGSIAVGKHIARLAAGGVKPCTLELGGHAPAIVFEDADVDAAISALVAAKFRNAGQVCVAPSRFFVQETIFKEFASRFADKAKQIVVGRGSVPTTTMGPLTHNRRMTAMDDFVSDAQRRGCNFLSGGSRAGNIGYFWEPTVVAVPNDDCRLMQEEPFGPIAPIAPFHDEREVLARANALPFGLAAYGFTRSESRKRQLRESLKAGMVGINSLAISLAEVPFGGVKQSGYGSEGGTEGLGSYLVTKLVTQALPGSGMPA